MSSEIASIRNLGPKSSEWLAEVGIRTRADLERLGPVAAYVLVRHSRSSCSLNLLWAMQAALDDIDWRELSPEVKQRLRDELAAMQESS